MAKKGETLTIAKVVLLQLKYNMKKKIETRVFKSKSIFPFFCRVVAIFEEHVSYLREAVHSMAS